MKNYLKTPSNSLKTLDIVNPETGLIKEEYINFDNLKKYKVKLLNNKIYEFVKNPKCKMVDLLLRFSNELTDKNKDNTTDFKKGLLSTGKRTLSLTFISSIFFYYKYEIVEEIIDEKYGNENDEENLPPLNWLIKLYDYFEYDFYGATNKNNYTMKTMYNYQNCKMILKNICLVDPSIITNFTSKEMYYFTKYKIVNESVHTDNINFLNYNLKYSKTFMFKEPTLLYLEKFLDYKNKIGNDKKIERSYCNAANKILTTLFTSF